MSEGLKPLPLPDRFMTVIAQYYDTWRALHVISVIFWMAGMLYLPRLFVYHHQSEPGGELEGAVLGQERRLLKIIMNPAMAAAWIFGTALVLANVGRAGGWSILGDIWWTLKFVLILAMTGIHGFYAGAQRRFANGQRPQTEKTWRMLNEVPALMTVAIVLIATIALR